MTRSTYWIGRTGGRRLALKFPWLARFLPRGERFFERHGGKAVFFARFIAGLRVAGAWVAGIGRMHWWRFLGWNAAGGIVWATGTVYLILFVVLNFWIERIWFPRPAPNLEPVPPLVGPVRRAHVAFGTVEAVVFIIGIVLIATGTSVMGTRGYGSF